MMSTTPNPPHLAPTDRPDPQQLTGATAAVWSALNSQPGATSTTLARAAGVGRSTTTKALRALEQIGLARREIPAAEDRGRPTHHWYATPAPDKDTSSSRDTSDGPSTENSAGPEPATPHADDPTHTAQPPAYSDDTPRHGQAHANDPDAEQMASDATDEAEQKTGSDSSPTPTPALAPAASSEGTVQPGTPEGDRPTTLPSQEKIRLAPGALRQMVIDHLTAHPDEAFTATRISRIIEKSSGAIANALATLAKQGIAEQVTEHPRTYRHTARPARPARPASDDA
ncbi:hypothetical protein [Streptomyces sp. NPDC094472]|uniref:helix-turn-helix domain-containing protein n=1 Tax=Streptomyces sp. NPDC094472 TaxID=3155080 RepID=UPI00331D6843